MSKYFVTATILYLAIGTGAAFAQTQSPATQPSSTLGQIRQAGGF